MSLEKFLLNSLFGKSGLEDDVDARGAPRLPRSIEERAAYFRGKYGCPTVTPDGHVFTRVWRPGLYRCCFCQVYRRVRNGRAEFMPSPGLLVRPSETSDLWSPEPVTCRDFDPT